MAISVVQRTSGGDAASAGKVAVAFGSNTGATNALIAIGFAGTSAGNYLKQPTDTQSNSYTLAGYADYAPQSLRVWCWIAYGSSAAACTVTTVESSFIDATLHIFEVAGLASSHAFDKIASQSQASATSLSSTATATTSYANELLIGASCNSHNTTPPAYTLGAGFSNLTTQNVTFCNSATEEQIVSATGAQTALFTLAANSDNEVTAIFTFADTPVSSGVGFNNYEFAKVGNGMSASERIR